MATRLSRVAKKPKRRGDFLRKLVLLVCGAITQFIFESSAATGLQRHAWKTGFRSRASEAPLGEAAMQKTESHPNSGVRFKMGVKISEKVDFWRWGKAPPPKINQRKSVCMIMGSRFPKVKTHPKYWRFSHFSLWQVGEH
ncbi:MAG: hypothetical protein JW892_07580 [Anaerolineae bacterium]|nr:hypothetical protein [Anaerolineae bacterium]